MLSISVIACVQNQKYELQKSLASVYEQSFIPQEIIIVDASSTNEVKEFVTSGLALYEQKTSCKIRYINVPALKEELVLTKHLLEIGIKNCTSEYSAFLVAGDVWKKEKLAQISNAIEQHTDCNFFITAYTQKIRFVDTLIDPQNYEKKYLPFFSLFQYWAAPSSVVAKTILPMALDAFNHKQIENLSVYIISSVLSEHYFCVAKNALAMEKTFWQAHYEQIQASKVVQEAALFCLYMYQNNKKTRNALNTFAKNVALTPDDVLKIVFGIQEFTITEKVEETSTVDINKKQQNYVLMRNWLELKISGSSIENVLTKKNIKSIAIYGAGKHGSMLCKDLAQSKINIVCWIDSRLDVEEHLGIKSYSIEEFVQKKLFVDAVIVTPITEFSSIFAQLTEQGVQNVISLDAIVRGV